MVLITRKTSIPISSQITKTSRIFTSILLGITCLIAPVVIVIVDPIHKIANFNLRLKPGSFLYNYISTEFKGARVCIYPFHISNAERFMAGDDPKLMLEEAGPFVYQEYRWYEDIKMSEDGTEMEATSKFRSEFVPEESMGYPKDINLTIANLPLLSATSTFSIYPGFMRSMFGPLAAQMGAKAIMNLDMHSYFWGYKDPLITLSNKLLPGLVYFDSIGLLDRLYDKEADYRILMGATSEDRFRIKSVKKYLRKGSQGGKRGAPVSELNFTDTYEGLGYPPELTPDVPINWYRVPICRTLNLQYTGSTTMAYGGEGLVYTISNSTFKNEQNPITREMHPDGLMDISACYYGLPFVASFSHFLDGDPKLLEAVDGLIPDRKKYCNQITIDRRIGVTFNTKISVQLNIAVADVSYNWEVRKFANTTLPILRLEAEQPKMPNNILFLFYLVYKIAPWIIIITDIALVVTGLSLMAYSAKSIYLNWVYRNRGMIFVTPTKKKSITKLETNVPLLNDNF